jgi:hypothetical protein
MIIVNTVARVEIPQRKVCRVSERGDEIWQMPGLLSHPKTSPVLHSSITS